MKTKTFLFFIGIIISISFFNTAQAQIKINSPYTFEGPSPRPGATYTYKIKNFRSQLSNYLRQQPNLYVRILGNFSKINGSNLGPAVRIPASMDEFSFKITWPSICNLPTVASLTVYIYKSPILSSSNTPGDMPHLGDFFITAKEDYCSSTKTSITNFINFAGVSSCESLQNYFNFAFNGLTIEDLKDCCGIEFPICQDLDPCEEAQNEINTTKTNKTLSLLQKLSNITKIVKENSNCDLSVF